MDVTGKEGPRRFLIRPLANGKIEGSLQDVTEKSIATEELDFLANNDSLTKVLNGAALNKFSRARWPGSTTISLAMALPGPGPDSS